MNNRRRTLRMQPALIENVRYSLPLKINIKNGKGHTKIKKIILLLLALSFIFILFKELGIWTNN